jgi:hypothetical protein
VGQDECIAAVGSPKKRKTGDAPIDQSGKQATARSAVAKVAVASRTANNKLQKDWQDAFNPLMLRATGRNTHATSFKAFLESSKQKSASFLTDVTEAPAVMAQTRAICSASSFSEAVAMPVVKTAEDDDFSFGGNDDGGGGLVESGLIFKSLETVKGASIDDVGSDAIGTRI